MDCMFDTFHRLEVFRFVYSLSESILGHLHLLWNKLGSHCMIHLKLTFIVRYMHPVRMIYHYLML